MYNAAVREEEINKKDLEKYMYLHEFMRNNTS